MKKEIIPAIIAKTQDELNDRLSRVIDLVRIVQLDFMDNKFVPNSSLDFDFHLPQTPCRFEAHLMIDNPTEWIERNGEKVDMILVHYESCTDPKNIIQKVKRKKRHIGFVVNPETPIDSLADILDDLNQVLIMTVNPGFYGSPFLPEMLKKIADLRKMNPTLDIEVDGGITDQTIQSVNEAGANMFVSGSYIVKAPDPQKAIQTMQRLVGT